MSGPGSATTTPSPTARVPSVTRRPPEVLRSTVRPCITSLASAPVSMRTGRLTATRRAHRLMSPGVTYGAMRSASPSEIVRKETPNPCRSRRATLTRTSRRPVSLGSVMRRVRGVSGSTSRSVLSRIPDRLTSTTWPTPTRPSADSRMTGHAVRIRGNRRRSRPFTSAVLLAPIVLIWPGRRVVLLFGLPDDHRAMGPQAVGDLGGVAGIVLAPIQDHSDLRVAGESLDQMAIELRLTASNDDEPALGRVSIQLVLVGVRHGRSSLEGQPEQGQGHVDCSCEIRYIASRGHPECTRIDREPDEKCPAADRLIETWMRKLLCFTLIAILLASGAAAQTPSKAPNPLEKTAADVIAATQNYRSALERVLAAYERDLARRQELADLRQELFEREV